MRLSGAPSGGAATGGAASDRAAGERRRSGSFRACRHLILNTRTHALGQFCAGAPDVNWVRSFSSSSSAFLRPPPVSPLKGACARFHQSTVGTLWGRTARNRIAASLLLPVTRGGC